MSGKDNIATIYAGVDIPEGETARVAQELKDSEGRLTINEVINLLLENIGDYEKFRKAIGQGDLLCYEPGKLIEISSEWAGQDERAEVYPQDLNKWLDKEYPKTKWRFPVVSNSGEGKRIPLETKIVKLVEIAQQLQYAPLKIPDGGKTEITKICLTEWGKMFASENAVEYAWKGALAKKEIRMGKHEVYAGGQN